MFVSGGGWLCYMHMSPPSRPICMYACSSRSRGGAQLVLFLLAEDSLSNLKLRYPVQATICKSTGVL